MFGDLYDRHAAVIYRYAARRAGDFVADDVTSETFLVAFEQHKLMQGIGAGPVPARQRPRRTLRRVAFASATAALLVGGIVISDVVGPSGHPGSTAEAAEILNNTAAAAIRASDPAVAPGQFLKIDTKAVYSTTTNAADGQVLGRLDTTADQLYIPADRSGTWVWDRKARIPTTFFSDAAKAEAAREQATAQGNGGAEIVRAPGGNFYAGKQTVLGLPLNEAMKTLPRDPGALLGRIEEKTRGAGPSPQSEALMTIADTLRIGGAPADVRAALFKAAALIPGMSVADRQMTLDGRTGVAMGVENADATLRQDIVVDPGTGLLIGELSP